MDRRLTILLILVLFIFITSACRNNNPSTFNAIFNKTEELLNNYPDSAKALLDFIENPSILSEESYNRYQLQYIRAKHKGYHNISEDSSIFKVYEFYVKKKDVNNKGMAAYYSGKVLELNEQPQRALKYYLIAEESINSTKSTQTKGLIQSSIGNLFYKKGLYNSALERMKLSKNYFAEANDHKNLALTLNYIGNCYCNLNKTDSAMHYYNKALNICEKLVLTQSERVYIIVNIGVSQFKMNNLEYAKSCFIKAISQTNSLNTQNTIYYNLSNTYMKNNQIDSAIYYLNMMDSSNSLNSNIVRYDLLGDIEEKKHNYKKALEYKKLYIKTQILSLEKRKYKELLEIQKKYDYQLIQNDNYQLSIYNKNIIIISFILFTIAIIIWFQQYKQSMKNKLKLDEAEKKISKLNEIAEKLDIEELKHNKNKKIILQHFDIVKKLATINSSLTNSEKQDGEKLLSKFNEIVYGSEVLDWEKLYDALNKHNEGFADKIRVLFPNLTETEFKICCLVYCRFDNTDISLMLNMTTGSIRTLKASLKKKIGAPKDTDLSNYIEKSIS